jgi:integrase
MTEIYFPNYAPDYRNSLEESDLASNTVEKRKICVNEFIEYCEENDTKIDTKDFYGSVDTVRGFFEQEEINVHGTKVSAIRDFLEFIGTQEDSRTEDQLDDIKEKVSLAKLKGKNQDIGKMDKKKIENKLLEDEEIQAAKNAGSEKASLLIDLMLDTAARPGEVVGLTPEDVDFDIGSFHVNGTWSDAKGEVQMNPKHDSYRRVKISQDTLELLEEYIEDKGIEKGEKVFPTYRGHVYNPIKKAFTQAQVRVNDGGKKTSVTPHWLRHNACTRLIQNGNSKEKVQEYMGHSSVQITEVYEHFDDSQVVDVELA